MEEQDLQHKGQEEAKEEGVKVTARKELRIPSKWQEGPCDGRGKDGFASVGWW